MLFFILLPSFSHLCCFVIGACFCHLSAILSKNKLSNVGWSNVLPCQQIMQHRFQILCFFVTRKVATEWWHKLQMHIQKHIHHNAWIVLCIHICVNWFVLFFILLPSFSHLCCFVIGACFCHLFAILSKNKLSNVGWSSVLPCQQIMHYRSQKLCLL